jgi:regulator of replication initiation timing
MLKQLPKQLQYESDMWKRQLGFMIEENIHLKNRLSAILKETYDSSFLGVAEVFQNRFIDEDRAIEIMRSEVAQFDKLVISEIYEDGKIKNEVFKSVKYLRKRIKEVETTFAKLKEDFSRYFADNIF